MNRSLVIVATISAVVLVAVVVVRFTGEPEQERAPGHRERALTTDAGGARREERDVGHHPSRERNDTAAAPRGAHASSGADGQPDDPRPGSRPAVKAGSTGHGARVDVGRGDGTALARRERGADTGLGGGRAADIKGDDANFRAAAERLAASDPAPPAQNDEPQQETADDVAHEPPATPVVDDSMTYNSGDYHFSLDSPFQIPNDGDTGTVSLWLQPEWSSENNEDAGVIELGDGLFRVYKNVNVLRFEVMSDNPEHSAGVSIAAWQPGEWHSVSATWAEQQVTFYVDGQPIAAPIRGKFAIQGNTPVTIGALGSDDLPVAPATVSDVSLRNRALPAEEIARLHNRSGLAKGQ